MYSKKRKDGGGLFYYFLIGSRWRTVLVRHKSEEEEKEKLWRAQRIRGEQIRRLPVVQEARPLEEVGWQGAKKSCARVKMQFWANGEKKEDLSECLRN